MATVKGQPLNHDLGVTGMTLGVHSSPLFVANKNAAAANNASVEAFNNDTNIIAIQAASPYFRFLDVFLCSYLATGTIGATDPTIRVYGSFPNTGNTSDLSDYNKQISVNVHANAANWPKGEHSKGYLAPLIPSDNDNTSTDSIGTFSIATPGLYSGPTNDLRMYQPRTFFLNGATTIYVAVQTPVDALTAGDYAWFAGRFTS